MVELLVSKKINKQTKEFECHFENVLSWAWKGNHLVLIKHVLIIYLSEVC